MRSPLRARRLASALALAALGAGSWSCNEQGVHLFIAARWVPGAMCLTQQRVVDVVDGNDPGFCAEVRCFTSPAAETYVSTQMCDAPADYVEVTEPEAGSPCALALAALEAETPPCSPEVEAGPP
jgi:hypothetical protein